LGCQTLGSYICLGCQKKVTGFCPQIYQKDVFIWLRYQGLTRKAIHRLKYRFINNLAQDLVSLALNKLPRETKQFRTNYRGYLITPVPLHRQRKNWRGFNQSASLAKVLAEQLNLTFKDGLLKRVKRTKIQANLPKEDRHSNLDQAFTASKKTEIENQKIIVFDDVFTTGITLREAGKILEEAGVSKVLLMALAG